MWAFLKKNQDIIWAGIRYLVYIVVILLVYIYILKPLSILFNTTTPIEYSKNIADLIKAIAWPIVAAIGLIALRRPLSLFLESIGQRASKLSAFNLEVQLSTVPQSQPLDIPSLTDIKQPDPTAWVSDSSGQLFEQIKSSSLADYAIVDLGGGREWLTSRLFIFAVMLERMRGLRCLVFLDSSNDANRRFVGMASPTKVRWALGRRYAWLEAAYIKAYSQLFFGDPKVMSPDMRYIMSEQGGLESYRAMSLVNSFLSGIQKNNRSAPKGIGGWVKLRDRLWERAEWLDEASLRKILQSNLQESSAPASPDILPPEQAKMVLRRKGAFVALVDDKGKFVSLTNRQALLEELATRLSYSETKN